MGLEVLLVKDVDEARVELRSMELKGNSLNLKMEIAVIGTNEEAFVWIGEKGGHCYGALGEKEMKAMVDMFNEARASRSHRYRTATTTREEE